MKLKFVTGEHMDSYKVLLFIFKVKMRHEEAQGQSVEYWRQGKKEGADRDSNLLF